MNTIERELGLNYSPDHHNSGKRSSGVGLDEIDRESGTISVPEVVVYGAKELQPWMKEETIRTYSEHAEEYAGMYVLREEFRQRVRPQVIKPFTERLRPIEPDTKERRTVLVIGVGPGGDAGDLLSAGYNLICIDPAEGMCEVANSHLSEIAEEIRQEGKEAPQFTVLKMGIEDFVKECPSEALDGIFANSALRHLPKWELLQVMGNFNRMLKPGGIMLAAIKEGGGEVVYTEDFGTGNGKRFSVTHTRSFFTGMCEEMDLKIIYLSDDEHVVSGKWRKWVTVITSKNGYNNGNE